MNWPRVLLGDVASVAMGQSPPGETYNDNGQGLPFFQGKAEFGDQHPVTAKWCTAPSRIAEAEDILLSVRAPVGPTNIAAEKCCIGRGLAAIRGRPEVVHQRFLSFFLRWVEPTLSRRGQGSTFDAIGRSDIERLETPMPALSEQRRIVEILDQADCLRRLRAEADAKAKRIPSAVFIKLFGDPAGSWKVHPLEDLLRKKAGALQSGPFGTHLHNSDFVPEGTALAVGIDNVVDGEFVPGRNRRITKEKYQELEKYTLDAGDVLITIMGTVGRSCVFPGLPSLAICTKHVYRIQVDDRVHPEYLSAALRLSGTLRGHLSRSITGQIVAGITSADLRALQVTVPPRRLQDAFAKTKADLDAHHENSRRVAERLDVLFRRLLHDAFSGDLTTTWREAHMKELLGEMEQQSRALAEVR